MNRPHFGLTGLAVMGQNLARNVAHKGFPIAVHNRSVEKTDAFMRDHGSEGDIHGSTDTASFVAALEAPRAIMIMVKAGAPVDAVIADLTPHLSPGDLLIDGGNSLFTDTERRVKALEAEGFNFLGTGVSGGEEGALNGPSIMPGGSTAAYELVKPIFTKIAAQVDGTPCCTYIGEGGSGHYVKMVHNGIEYADMQLIAEAYDLLKNALGLSNDEIGEVFTQWNQGDLELVPDRDHRDDFQDTRRGDGRLPRRLGAGPRGAEGHGQVDLAERPRPGRSPHRHHRGRFRPVPVGPEGSARGRLQGTARPVCDVHRK